MVDHVIVGLAMDGCAVDECDDDEFIALTRLSALLLCRSFDRSFHQMPTELLFFSDKFFRPPPLPVRFLKSLRDPATSLAHTNKKNLPSKGIRFVCSK